MSNTKEFFKCQPLNLPIYSFCAEDKKFMVVFSILLQYFRYFIPPFILGLSPKHLHLYKYYFKIKMTWLLVLSGSKGFVIPKIILGAFMYCMFRPQFSKIFTDENQIFFVYVHSQNRCNKLSLVSVQKVHSSVSFKPHLKRKEFVAVILWDSLN